MKSNTTNFINRSLKIHGHRYQYHLVKYTGWDSKVDIVCSIHGIFQQRANCHLNGSGCRKCSYLKQTKTHETYLKEVQNLPNIAVLDIYQGDSVKIKHKCLSCNHIWKVLPSNIIQGHGCPKCSYRDVSQRCRKTHEQYCADLLDKHSGNILVLENYKGAQTKILHQCLACKHKWMVLPTNILNKKGCPRCKSSYGEKAIAKYLKDNDIQFESQKIFEDCACYKFDFYLPQYNLVIEYDGIQHFEPVEFFGGEEKHFWQLVHDDNKNHCCERNKIRLLRISCFEKGDMPNLIGNALTSIKAGEWW